MQGCSHPGARGGPCWTDVAAGVAACFCPPVTIDHEEVLSWGVNPKEGLRLVPKANGTQYLRLALSKKVRQAKCWKIF